MNNDYIIDNLINLYKENRFSHVFLIETNDVERAFESFNRLFKALSCNDEYLDKCSKCNICNLVQKNEIPTIKVVEPDGKSIKKDAIDEMKHVMMNKPIYGKNNIYVIKNAEKMNDTAFNRLLKFIEEPLENTVGFFFTVNKDYMPDTIVSRCELIKMNFEIEQFSEEYEETVDELLSIIENVSSDKLCYNINEIIEKYGERTQVVELLNKLLQHYLSDVNSNNYKKIKIINKYLVQLNYNVNLSLMLNSFIIEMVEIDG